MKKLNYQTGKMGEKIAQNFLLKNGYKIIATNFRTYLGEIDIIAGKEKTLVFVEVKLKIGEEFGTPEEMINKRKINQVKMVATQFLQTHPQIKSQYSLWRLDAICLVLNPDGSSKRITHWQNIEL
ncbi:MAG: YraN family protein [Microgenomates group bacterium]